MSTDLEALLRDPLSVGGDDSGDILAAFEKAAGGNPDVVSPDDIIPDAGAAATTQPDPASTKADTTTSAPAGAGDAGAQSDQQQGGKAPGEPDGVLMQDGKTIVGFGVLRGERERRMRAEMQAQELAEKLAQLEAQAKTGQPTTARDTSQIISPDDLAVLREESPQIAAAFDAMIARTTDLEGRIAATSKPVEDLQREQELQRRVTAEETVESAIASVPKLAHLREHDPDAFNEVASIDGYLRARPEWADKPMSERFIAAVRMHEAQTGAAIQLPTAAPAAPAATADTAARVTAAIAKAQSAAPAPSTLSDIPGGHLPPQNDIEVADQMSSAALTNQLMSMTPEQQADFLAKFA